MQLLLRDYCYARHLLLCLLLLSGSFAVLAQGTDVKISYEARDVKAGTVLQEIGKQTGSTLTYDQEKINTVLIKKISWDHIAMQQALKELRNYGIAYSISGNNIALKLVSAQSAPKLAGPGKITGTIVDEETGEALGGTTIKIGDQSFVSNIDGSFSIALPKGAYSATISSVGYGTKNVTDIEIGNDRITTLNLTLKKQHGTLSGVVVTTSARRESVASLYVRQKNNAGITDGISAEQIGRTPDRNVSESLKRISGLSTMDNRYVVVRGLSERYNGAVLNGQLMPSTELNRRNFSFDIIPTNMVENITVIKTLTPDQNAEFGGGLVEINTLEVPSQNFLTLSVGGSVNEKTTGKPFLSLELEGREYLANVSKHRELLGSLDWKTGFDAARFYTEHGSNSDLFSNNWGITSMKAQPSQNYQLALGRAIKLKGSSQLGLTASASYRNTLNRVDINTGREGWSSDTHDGSTGETLLGARGERYDFVTNLGATVGVGYRQGNHRISFQSLYLRTLNQQLSVIYDGIAPDAKGNWGMYDLTTQTTLWQNQLKGEHQLNKKGLKVNWRGNYIYLNKLRPDNHVLLATVNDKALAPDSNNISATDFSSLYGFNRWWSRALEKNYNWEASVTAPFFIAGNTQSFKAGYAGWNKDRLFYVVNVANTSNGAGLFSLPLASAFGPEYRQPTTFIDAGDSMHKSATLHAFYGMLDNRLDNKWRLVWGLRAEYLNMGNLNGFLDHQEAAGLGDFTNWRRREKNWQFFPSANLTYSLTNQMNLRMAYARSIIRPDLRELAYFHEYDYELGGEYGGADVRSTTIDHYDLRYEWYPSAGDVISVTGFFKDLHYPMEIFQQPNRFFELKNSKEAQNYGIETEVRKSLAFTGVPVIRNLTVYGNFTYMDARVRSMQIKAVPDPNHPNRTTPVEDVFSWEKRPQAGASNYIFNAGLYYDSKFISASMVYNQVSNRLVRVVERTGNVNSIIPPYYEQPVRSLDAQLAVRLLKRKMEVKMNIANLLNSFYVVYSNRETPDKDGNLTKKQSQYQSGRDLVDYKAAFGRTYSATITYTLR